MREAHVRAATFASFFLPFWSASRYLSFNVLSCEKAYGCGPRASQRASRALLLARTRGKLGALHVWRFILCERSLQHLGERSLHDEEDAQEGHDRLLDPLGPRQGAKAYG